MRSIGVLKNGGLKAAYAIRATDPNRTTACVRCDAQADSAADLEDGARDCRRAVSTDRGIVERTFPKGAYVCHRGDRLDAWIGVVEGLIKLGSISETGKDVTLAGLRTGCWFGEGSVLKDEPRQYDLAVLRDTRLAFMNRATFLWLFENSVGFNRFLVRQFNERLGQFIALVEYDRTLNATARLARSIAWLFNPVLYPQGNNFLEISQEEIGMLSGISRPAANEALKTLEGRGLIELTRMGLAVKDLHALLQQRD
jgi:CRP/FNR family cyclic AMP-dependent transcriptional regulator